MPVPEYLVAEPAPNDNGTHVGLRWARLEGADAEFEYVIFIRRGPGRRWFECRRVPPGSGLVTDADVAGFYPYRFREGDEHHVVLEPAASMTIYWLAAEKRHAEWVKRADGALQDCQQRLLAVERGVAELRRLQGRLEHYRPLWQGELLREKEQYIRDAGLDAAPEELTVLAHWGELADRLRALGEAESGETERQRLNERLGMLRRARVLTLRLEEAEAGVARLESNIAATRESYLRKAAEFACICNLLQAETQLQLGGLLGLAPADVTPQAVADHLAGLAERLAQAQQRSGPGVRDAAEYDEFDRLRYALNLARAYVARTEKGISPAEIENDLLWQMGRTLSRSGLDTDGPGAAPAAPPETERLAEALARVHESGLRLEANGEPDTATDEWRGVWESLEPGGDVWERWAEDKAAELRARLDQAEFQEPDRPHAHRERTRLTVLSAAAQKRLKRINREHAGRRYHFRLAWAGPGQTPPEGRGVTAAAAPASALFDMAKLVNLVFALFFTGAVLGMVAHVRRHPDVFVRRIAGLEAVDEAIGRATEMGKPALFVHGLTGVSDIAVLASLSILGRIARRIAEHDSDLLVVNNDPIVYSISYEVVQEGYRVANRPDAFNSDNIFMAASQQFPYVAAVAGIMARRKPAANFFMGYFYAESLILAEVGASTGAIQIAATDAFIQIPFFITTCDYTLMGEELYAAGAYLSRNAKMLATLKAQDLGKAVLMAALPLGLALSNLGVNWLQVLFTAYEKGF